jgi:hypothetical protein
MAKFDWACDESEMALADSSLASFDDAGSIRPAAPAFAEGMTNSISPRGGSHRERAAETIQGLLEGAGHHVFIDVLYCVYP